MFALGCIKSMSCHTDRCPTGIATQDPRRRHRLDVPDKVDRVFNYHDNALKALRELLSAAGLRDTAELGPEHIIHRVSSTEVRSLGRLYPFLEPGQLLTGTLDDERHAVFKMFWHEARPDTFDAPARVLALRTSKLTQRTSRAAYPRNDGGGRRQPSTRGRHRASIGWHEFTVPSVL